MITIDGVFVTASRNALSETAVVERPVPLHLRIESAPQIDSERERAREKSGRGRAAGRQAGRAVGRQGGREAGT